MTDSTLQRARQRALATTQPRPKQNAESGLRNASSVTTEQRFVEVPARGKTYRVPDPQFYAMSSADRERFFDEVDNARDKERGRNEFDQTALFLTDQLEIERKARKALEGQVATLMATVEGMQRQQESQDASLELQRSEALAQQQVEIAQQTINLQAVGASEQAAHDRRMKEAQDQAAITDGQLAVQKTLGDELRSYVKSTTTLNQEITNSVKNNLADLQQRVERLKVQQQENTDGINFNRDTLRAFTGYDLEAAIDSKVNQSFDNRLEPAMSELVERKYVITAPTNGTDGYNPKIEEKGAFLAINKPDDAIDRAVKTALKKGGRS